MPILLDPDRYPHLVVGRDSLVAVHGALPMSAEAPLLTYARNSFLGRIVSSAGVDESRRIAHVNENAMAEGLKVMALEGHGVAWVPRSLAARELAEGRLIADRAGNRARNPPVPQHRPPPLDRFGRVAGGRGASTYAVTA